MHIKPLDSGVIYNVLALCSTYTTHTCTRTHTKFASLEGRVICRVLALHFNAHTHTHACPPP
jgi:hypothetical protein